MRCPAVLKSLYLLFLLFQKLMLAVFLTAHDCCFCIIKKYLILALSSISKEDLLFLIVEKLILAVSYFNKNNTCSFLHFFLKIILALSSISEKLILGVSASF